ncbi:hypothetical protein [Ideonella sp. BN130291]|uniref:hypothetical protein n=1 Tax=Ideonella sp. BN130291 TaxID=3112940 RepID=UPI002E269834|nr:hypothetical protein [Ideonella sp. BN130291]
MALRADRFIARGLSLRLGAVHATVAELQLQGVDLLLAVPGAPGAGPLRGGHIDQVLLQGVDITPGGAAALPAVPVSPAAWRLEPLAGLEGTLRALVTDAAWIVDADITLPLQAGVLDFDRVVVEHVGPNSVMGISRGGLYVDAPNLGRRYLLLFTGADVPGARFEHRSAGFGARVSERGAIDLAGLVQGLLSRADTAPIGKPANEEVQASLDRTRLSGELHLGDGWLGTARQHAALVGQAHGKNRVSLLAEVLGHKLVASIPELTASEAAFDLGGLPARCGSVLAQVHAELTGLRGQPQMRLTLPQMTLRDVTLGEPVA